MSLKITCYIKNPFSFFDPLQQLMRERQQMASRPFGSVAVVLEVGGDQEELLQVSRKIQI